MLEKSVIIDNDIGIFFSALNMENWQEFDRQPKIIAVTGSMVNLQPRI